MQKLQNFQILITFCVVLLLCNQNYCWAWRAFNVIFTSFPHEFNSNLMDVKIHIQNDTAEPTLNVAINVLEDIDDISFSYAVAIENEKPNSYTVLLNRTVHLCKFLQLHTIDNVLRIIYEDVSKQDKFIKVCPLKKGTVYTLQDYSVNEELLPRYVPEAKFYVDIQVDRANGDDGVMVLKGRLHGKIDKSKGFNNLKAFSIG